eukprot:Opistho-2@82637
MPGRHRLTYTCESWDMFGVHSNSGVFNRAYALLVDGGFANIASGAGIGFQKALHIIWRAQTEYLLQYSTYALLASSLNYSCLDYSETQTPLNKLVLTGASTWGPTTVTITQADCDVLSAVIAEVGMTGSPCPALGAVKSLKASKVTKTGATISWTKPDGFQYPQPTDASYIPSYYEVTVTGAGGPPSTSYLTNPGGSITGLKGKTKYTVSVTPYMFRGFVKGPAKKVSFTTL